MQKIRGKTSLEQIWKRNSSFQLCTTCKRHMFVAGRPLLVSDQRMVDTLDGTTSSRRHQWLNDDEQRKEAATSGRCWHGAETWHNDVIWWCGSMTWYGDIALFIYAKIHPNFIFSSKFFIQIPNSIFWKVQRIYILDTFWKSKSWDL